MSPDSVSGFLGVSEGEARDIPGDFDDLGSSSEAEMFLEDGEAASSKE